MEEPISVAAYCKRHNTSTQAVYAKIKRGTIQSTIVNGLKMVFDEDDTIIAPDSNAYTILLQETIADQRKEIKRLHKRIRQIEKRRDNIYNVIVKLLDSKHSQSLIAAPDNIIDVKPRKSKSKKKSRKKKSRKKKKK